MKHKCRVRKSRLYYNWIYECGVCGVQGYRSLWHEAIMAALNHLRGNQ